LLRWEQKKAKGPANFVLSRKNVRIKPKILIGDRPEEGKGGTRSLIKKDILESESRSSVTASIGNGLEGKLQKKLVSGAWRGKAELVRGGPQRNSGEGPSQQDPIEKERGLV